MKLSEWMEPRDISASDLADLLGVHKSTVGRWLDGSGKPSWEQLGKISSLTEGAVTANDFLDIPIKEADAA